MTIIVWINKEIQEYNIQFYDKTIKTHTCAKNRGVC